MTARSTPVYFGLCFALSLTWLLIVDLPTMGDDYLGEFMRIGMKPWSDAHAWTAGADSLLSGQDLSDMAARRPLYPLFLAVMTALTGEGYRSTAALQFLLTALGFATAATLLRPVRHRTAATALAAFFLVWRPEVSTVFMTEWMALPILMLAFSSIWRGLDRREDGPLLVGCLLLGVSQAVRPWAVFCLATVPAIALFASGQNVWRRLQRAAVVFLFVALGFSLQPISGALFTQRGANSTQFGVILHAQLRWETDLPKVWDEPEIWRLREAGASAFEINRAILRVCWRYIREDPGRIAKPMLASWKRYPLEVNWSFRREPPFVAALVLGFLLLSFFDRRPATGPALAAIATAAGLGLALGFFFTVTMGLLLIVGLVVCLLRRGPFDRFLLLYLLGVLLSLPLVGANGGPRVRLGADPLHFAIAAVGAGWLLNRLWRSHPSRPAATAIKPAGRRTLLLAPALTLAILIGVPLLVRTLGSDPTIRFDDRLDRRLSGDPSLVSHSELDRSHRLYAEVDSEVTALIGRRGFRFFRFRARDAIEFSAGEGLEVGKRVTQLWPLEKRDFPRTIVFVGPRFLILPGIRVHELEEFGNRQFAVVGWIDARERDDRYHTPWALVAEELHVAQDDGSSLRIDLPAPPMPAVPEDGDPTVEARPPDTPTAES